MLTKPLTTLVELRAKLQLGTQIIQIWNDHEGDVSYLLTVDKIRTYDVRTTHTGMKTCLNAGIYWLSFPDRPSIILTENGWIRMKGGKKRSEYIWVEEEKEEAA